MVEHVAQSIGEPATQNSKYFPLCWCSVNQMLQEYSELRELLRTQVRNLKCKYKDIFEEFNNVNQNKAEFVKNALEYTILKDIVEKSEIYYDPKNTLFDTDITDDKEMLSIYKEFIDFNEIQMNVKVHHGSFDVSHLRKKNDGKKYYNGRCLFKSLISYDNKELNLSDDNSKELIGRISGPC